MRRNENSLLPGVCRTIKPFWTPIIILILLISSCSDDSGNGDDDDDDVVPRTTGQNLTYEFSGTTRSYHLYVPEGASDNAPLVFVLHGYDQDHNYPWDSYGMNAVAEAEGFAVCYPLGSPTSEGIIHWNASLNVGTADDAAFLVQLASELQSVHGFDPNRTFISGMSNGGFMSYELACSQPGVFKAIAVVAGTMSGGTWSSCDPDPLPVLHIHGDADRTVPIGGVTESDIGFGGAPAISEIIQYWSEVNSNTQIDSTEFNTSTTLITFSGGSNDVLYYRISGGGHFWPGQSIDNGNDISGFSASEVIWEFFKNQ